jgi:mycofactocin system glycosyltransferase
MFSLARIMNSDRRFIADTSWRRPENGTVVLAGSPLTLFSLSQAGKTVAECIEHGLPLPPGHDSLTNRLMDAGAIHPVPSATDREVHSAQHITAVIPAYIHTAHESQALRSLVAQCQPFHSVIVIDDNSPHALPELGSTLVIRNGVNRGPAAARNAGLARVTTEFVAFFDVDVSISRSTIVDLLPYFTDEKVGLIAPRVKSRAASDALSEYELVASVLDMGSDEARVAPGTRVSYVPSAAWLCRTSALQSIDGFDEALRTGEDVDAVWRLHAAGWRARYQPQSVCTHSPRQNVQQFVQQRISYGASAAPLALRHSKKLGPVRLNWWQASTWSFALLGMPFVALCVAIAAAVSTRRKLRAFPQLGNLGTQLSFAATAKSGLSIARALSRVWWPIGLIAAMFSQRLRIIFIAAALGPALYEWWKQRPHLDIVRFSLLKMLDNAAYGTGVWKGVVATRSPAPIIPTVQKSATNEQ